MSSDSSSNLRDLHLLVDLAPAAVAICRGPEHVVTFANGRLRAHAGGREVLGRRFRDAFPDLVDGPLHEALDRAFGAGEAVPTDALGTGALRPMLGANGQVEGVVLYLVTADAPQMLEDRALALDRREAALAARERAASDLAAPGLVSHALRTPLHVLMGYATLLRAELAPVLTPKAEEHLLRLMGSAEVMARLVDDILDLQHLRAGTLALQPRAIGFAGLLEDAVGRLRERAAAKGLALEAQIMPGLPAVFVDGPRLGRVVELLLDNAVKHTPAGGRIVVRARADMEAVACVIQDTGEGIDPAVLPRLFVPFGTLDTGLTRPTGGPGLGLALGRAITEAHGGRLWLESEPGRGTTCHLHLPVAGPAGRSPARTHG